MATNRPTMFIIAPVEGATPTETIWHLNRAVALASVMVRKGYAPLLVHPMLQSETLPANPDIYNSWARATAAAVGAAEGNLVVLRRPNGTISDEDFDIIRAFYRGRGKETPVRSATWQVWIGWQKDFAQYGMEEVWTALHAPPET